MMEEYMMKTRMKKSSRNDFDDKDHFEEKIYDDLSIGKAAKKKLSKAGLGLGFLAFFTLFCLINRRKGGRSPILLSDYKEELEADIEPETDDSDAKVDKKKKKSSSGKTKELNNKENEEQQKKKKKKKGKK